MLTTILTIVIIPYVLFFWKERKKSTISIGERATKWLRILCLGISLLLIATVILAQYNIFLRGYWTTKVLFWVFIVSGMVLFVFGHRPTQKKVERVYYGLLFSFPLFGIVSAFIPFYGWVVAWSIQANLVGQQSDIKYADNRYRLENTFKGMLAKPSPPDLVVKRGLFEHKEKPLDVEYLGQCDSIRIDELSEKTIKITFYHGGHYISEKEPVELIVDLEN